MLPWLGLIIAGAVVLWSGKHLSATGESIALKSGLGFTWVGMVFIAGATALPEFFTSLSATVVERSPDLAVGNCLGSIAFNLSLVLALDVAERRGNILSLASENLVLSAGLSIVLLSVIGGSLWIGEGQRFLSPSWTAGIVAVAYLWGLRMTYRHERSSETEEDDEESDGSDGLPGVTWTQIWTKYGALAATILVASIVLASSGEAIARQTRLGSTFVGFLLVAICTSLPEATATIAAIRLGKVDMALGNIIGSNLFNIFIICICELAWSGSLAVDCSPHHQWTIFLNISLTAMLIMGVVYKSERRVSRVGVDTVCIGLAYLLGVLFLFRLSLGG